MKKDSKRKKILKLFSFKNNTTIRLTVMITIIFIVCIVEVVMFVYTKESMRNLRHNVSSEFISNIKVFNDDLNSELYSVIINDINSVLTNKIPINYILITDKQKNELYSSLPLEAEYIFKMANNPASIKLLNMPGKENNEYKILFIDKPEKNVYLIMSVGKERETDAIIKFMQMFFVVVIILSGIISYIIAKSISRPIIKMEETISRIAHGDLSAKLDYTKYQELNKLVLAYNMMTNALQRLYSSLEVKVQDRTSELEKAYAELKNTQSMMVHSEKMKSLGELVAGIMHEINNPINFIYGNMTHLNNYSQDLIEIIEKYSAYEESLSAENKQEISNFKEEIDYEFLKSDMPDLIKSCREGAERAKNIIQDLKSFSRMEEATISNINVPHEIDLTLNILHNKLKNKIEIHKEYAENLPNVEAFGGQLNQVFMNIIDNATCAIVDKGDIWIRIDSVNDNIKIEIEDNGTGMDDETIRKVFNPFFTTKPVGQGTGLGMSITYKIIKNHQGEITVQSILNQGTKFIITLPLKINREKLTSNNLALGGINDQI